MLVEILITNDCPHEEPAIDLVGKIATALGVAPRVVLVEVHDLEESRQHRFVGSPTIRINGVDVAAVEVSDEAFALAFRIYATSHGRSGVPDHEAVEAALSAARAQGG